MQCVLISGSGVALVPRGCTDKHLRYIDSQDTHTYLGLVSRARRPVGVANHTHQSGRLARETNLGHGQQMMWQYSGCGLLSIYIIIYSIQTTTMCSNDTLVDTPFQLISGFFHVNQGV